MTALRPVPPGEAPGAVIRERSKWSRLSGAGDGRDVVAEGMTPQCAEPRLPYSACTVNSNEASDIFDAAKLGDIKKCQQIIEMEGTNVLDSYDEKGHMPAHWAALTGATEVLQYFLDCKGPVDEPSRAELGQRPIHWAAASGDISATDLLLKAGVSIEVEDQKGRTPLITAAQYGQTALCCYLMSKGAKLHTCDSEGDNALHWTAFKGYCELTHLLLYSGCDAKLPDSYGQTPLHLAVLSGDLPTVQLLCEQDGVGLKIRDNNGNTPLKLAKGLNAKNIVSYLQSEISRIKNRNQRFDWRTWVIGRPERTKAPILFFYGNLFLWGYPTYFYQLVPVSLYALWDLHITFLVGNALMWFFFLSASLMDPGFLPCHSEAYDRAIKQVSKFNDWEKDKNPLSRLCHTCHLVKPLRSKHCRVTNRCVACFDHYCPYLYNNVGYRNRAYFVAFLATMCMNCTIGAYLCWDWFDIVGRSFFLGMGFLFLSVNAVISGGMAALCVYMAAVNITTNERMNYMKYSYLKDENGRFVNPFNRGILLNLLEFCHLIPSLREDQIRKAKLSYL
ncbi:hypothetical protein NDU88_004618 [Pleurodeles waltl]|uniref:Palmitoyltransferase n=1 Tax=Pleurodeles waltl TaxID=8319 RepID=A0AAV7WWC2_PLEWA|nr:hypothetical protein NDU88_004618 [Pleurodeles waltl]